MNDDRYDRRGGSRPGPDGPWQRNPGSLPQPPRRPGQPGQPSARRQGEEPPTDMLLTVGREPDLMTHHQPLLAGPPNGNRDSTPERAGALSGTGRGRSPRKKIWRRVRRTCYVLAGLGILGPIVAFFIAYQFVKVPSPQDILSSASQVGTINYADGTEMTKILPKDNHSLVQYQAIPEHLRQAVYAAEDRTFLQNRGFDFQGIARAVWSNLRGGGGGGSTISQQYVKNASNNKQATLTRKFVELVTSAKMSKSSSKQDIITAYLNIIYFGRGATGISDAAQAYFGKPINQLTVSESALLAGVIQSPSNWDPSVDLPAAKSRWNYVLDGMVTDGAISKTERDAQQFPAFLPRAQGTALLRATLNGPRRYIQDQVMTELEAQGITQNDINQQGLKITTTIDPKAQQAAEAAYQDVMVNTKQPDYLRGALVAVDPKTGGVIAYDGGGDGTGKDYASELNQPGSSFKPFVFTADLQQGGYLYETYDGSDNRMFPGRTTPVRNSSGASCKPVAKSCTVKDAMTQSVNTVFYDMGMKVGTGAVAKAAYQAGIPKTVNNQPLLVGYNSNNQPDPNLPPDGNISIGGGNTKVRPVDMAYAYATFANNGTKHGTAPHFVSKVVNSQGNVVYQSQDQATQAFDANPTKNADIARNVTESMTSVASGSYIPLAGGRPVAAKTGTEQSATSTDPNADSNAWTVGYTPSVAAAAWVGADSDMAIKGNYPCKACGGAGHDIFGRMEPGVMWQKFMDAYLNGTPHEQFSHLQLLNAPPPPPSTSQETPSSAQPTTTTPTPTTSDTPTETTRTRDKKTNPTPTPGCSLLGPCDTSQPPTPTTFGGPTFGGPPRGGGPVPTPTPTG